MKIEYPTISYAIPVCNEHLELEKLLNQIGQFVSDVDQIVIQCDAGNTTDDVFAVLNRFKSAFNKCAVHIYEYPLKNNFSEFKNHLKSKCTCDYVFQIDADELLGDSLLMHLPVLLHDNPDTDLFFLPRINIVKGLTKEYAESQYWNVRKSDFPIAMELNEDVVNFPDRQARLFRNKPEIKWRNRVHEVITGHRSYVDMASGINGLDPDEIQSWCLIHIKELDRQIKQNEKYSKIVKSSYE